MIFPENSKPASKCVHEFEPGQFTAPNNPDKPNQMYRTCINCGELVPVDGWVLLMSPYTEASHELRRKMQLVTNAIIIDTEELTSAGTLKWHEYEKMILKNALSQFNKAEVARLTGYCYKTIVNKCKEYDLNGSLPKATNEVNP